MAHKVQFTRVFDILRYQVDRFPQEKAVNTFRNKIWNPMSSQALVERANAVSCWLLSKGYRKGDLLIITPHQGSREWLLIDFACQQIGVIVVPLHPTLQSDDLLLIVEEINPVLIIVKNKSERVKFSEVSNCPIQSLDDTGVDGLLISDEYSPKKTELEQLEIQKKGIKPEDILTIMYTSGTSGEPKGIILTHNNMVSNILFSLAAFPLDPGLRVMSFLPFSHILERSACYAYLASGSSLYFVRNSQTFVEDFKTARPQFTVSVPKVLEKMYAFLLEQTHSQNWLKKVVASWAINTAKEYNKKQKDSIYLSAKLFLARMLILNKWKGQLGGRLRCIVVGAAALDPEIARMFSAAKIRIREGYGMTEASPLISLNRFDPGMNRFGTVGLPIPALELIIVEKNEENEGEIWIKGPNVTQGYYKRPKLNELAFSDDGWFKTGDIGKMIDGKFLQITDRKKDIFKTSSGKYIAPLPLENKLRSSSFIEQSLVIGFSRPHCVALIVPDFKFLKDWCLEENIHWTSPEYMIHNIKVYEKMTTEIEVINENLAKTEQIKGFVLAAEEWSTQNNLLTTTMKPIRKNLLELFKKDIDKIYS